jgi:hypothetical protein
MILHMNICKKAAIAATLLFSGSVVYAQTPNWQNMDLQKDSVFGVSVEKAYTTLLKDKKIQTSYCCSDRWWRRYHSRRPEKNTVGER